MSTIKQAYQRFFAGEKPSFSTGICETPTAGYGELGTLGYFEYPLNTVPDETRVMYRMFIDDERFPASEDPMTLIVRSSAEAIEVIKKLGVPYFVSYDHDLGGDDTSMIFINWMIDAYLDGELKHFPINYYVHSQNPVGARNIKYLL